MTRIVAQTIVKDEDHIIKEWVYYHLLIGFEHLYIYDDQSNNSVSELLQVLSPEFANKVTVILIDEFLFTENKSHLSPLYDENLNDKFSGHKHKYILNHFATKFKKNAEWCFFCDVDEFLVLNSQNTLEETLNKYSTYDCISIPWLQYGSSFNVEMPNGLILENFLYHDNQYHYRGKSISKLNKLEAIYSCHIVGSNVIEFDYTRAIGTIPLQVNHYRILNIKLFIQRKLRGELGYSDGSARPSKEILRLMLSFNKIKSPFKESVLNELRILLRTPRSNIKSDLPFINVININSKYISISSDIKVLDLKAFYKNDISFCTTEQCLPPDFDVDKYKSINPDIKYLQKKEAELHYINFGYIENREYKIDSEYSDAYINDNDSFKFKRELPSDFEVSLYKELHKELEHVSNVKAINHYRMAEVAKIYKLNLPPSFDVNNYRIKHLKNPHLSDVKVKFHYLKNDSNETI